MIIAGTLALGADNALPITARLLADSSDPNTTFDLRGYSQRIAMLTLNEAASGSFQITNTAAALSTFTVFTDDHFAYGSVELSNDEILAGNLRLVKDGSGILELSGNNTFSGGTLVQFGILRLNNDRAALGAPTSIVTIADGAAVDASGQSVIYSTDRVAEAIVSGSGPDGFGAIQNTGVDVRRGNFWNALTLAGDTTIGTDSRYDLDSGVINGGTFTLTKVGSGETWWSPTAGASIGDIVIESGTFGVQSSDNLGSDAHRILVHADGTLAVAGGRTNSKPITLDDALFTAISGMNDWNGALTLEGTGTSNRIGASEDARLNIGGSITGIGGFEKVDAGTVELLGDSSGWGGEIKLSDGTLLVSGNVSGSTVTVNGGILGGDGGTLGLINLNDGTLAPGASIGTLDSGDVSFAAEATFHLEIDSSVLTTDLLASSGSVNVSFATLTIDDLGTATLTAGERFTFITANSITGMFADLPDGAPLMVGKSQFTIDYTPTSVALVAVPEPGALTTLMAGLGVAMGIRRKRR